MKKKQLASLFLAGVIAASLAVPAMATAAESSTSWDNSSSGSNVAAQIPVTASADNLGISSNHVYFVDVAWTMTPAQDTHTIKYKWNTETLKYDQQQSASTEGTFTNAKVDITLTNKSDAVVYWAMDYQAAATGATALHSPDSQNDKTRYDNSGSVDGTLASAASGITDDNFKTTTGVATTKTYSMDVYYCSGYNAASLPTMGTYSVKLATSSGSLDSGTQPINN